MIVGEKVRVIMHDNLRMLEPVLNMKLVVE